MTEFNISQLEDPHAIGVVKIESFADENQIDELQAETADPRAIQWLDAHDVYPNARGLEIIQNHFTFALELERHDTSALLGLPLSSAMMEQITVYVQSLSDRLPPLADWAPNEFSYHKYDDPEIGLSFHRDNIPYVGVVAILSVFGECDFSARSDREEVVFKARPGDLFLLRATGLIDYDGEIRPEHAVTNITTLERISMMLRKNADPENLVQGFKYNNVK